MRSKKEEVGSKKHLGVDGDADDAAGHLARHGLPLRGTQTRVSVGKGKEVRGRHCGAAMVLITWSVERKPAWGPPKPSGTPKRCAVPTCEERKWEEKQVGSKRKRGVRRGQEQDDRQREK